MPDYEISNEPAGARESWALPARLRDTRLRTVLLEGLLLLGFILMSSHLVR